MDASAERDRKLRQLNGALQIEMVCKTPLPSLQAHARSCASFAAISAGLGLLSEAALMKIAIVSGAMLGVLGPKR
jgi:hypothetical protein